MIKKYYKKLRSGSDDTIILRVDRKEFALNSLS